MKTDISAVPPKPYKNRFQSFTKKHILDPACGMGRLNQEEFLNKMNTEWTD
jgi:2-polyprenyl-3-methyl-5-hydroxy-6-metoxy-1,4-benzoquinol methylase